MEFLVGKPKIYNSELFLERVKGILRSSEFSNNGMYVRKVEKHLKELLGVSGAVLVSNATIGLELCLKLIPKSTILVPSYTFIGSIHAITNAGHIPKFIDVTKDYCIDAKSIETDIWGTTNILKLLNVGILPVNLFGNICNLEAINNLGIPTVFDSAHSNGMESCIKDFGLAEVYSGHPTKLAGGFEIGSITTNSLEVEEKLKNMRNFGFDLKDGQHPGEVKCIGTNAKVSEIQAAAFLTQLEYLTQILNHYASNWKVYSELLPNWISLVTPNTKKSNYSYIVCQVDEDIQLPLQEYLKTKGIHTKTYFFPNHLTNPYKTNKQLPMTEYLAKRTICFPTGLHVGKEDIETIVQEVKNFKNTKTKN